MADPDRARRFLTVWFVSTLALTLAPFGPLRAQPEGFGWIHPASTRLGPFDFYANIALFVPLGVFGVAAGMRRRMAVALGLLFSFAIECTQMYLQGRYPSNFDVVANATGAAAGALASAPLLALGTRLWQAPVRAVVLVAGGAAALVLAARFPQIRRFGAAFPFALAVLAGLAGNGVVRPRAAFLLAAAGSVALCMPLWWPPSPEGCVLAAAGAALGVWPGLRPARLSIAPQ